MSISIQAGEQNFTGPYFHPLTIYTTDPRSIQYIKRVCVRACLHFVCNGNKTVLTVACEIAQCVDSMGVTGERTEEERRVEERWVEESGGEGRVEGRGGCLLLEQDAVIFLVSHRDRSQSQDSNNHLESQLLLYLVTYGILPGTIEHPGNAER